jgi:hypothetical protein
MGELAMMDELVIEEMSIRAVQEKMDEAFRAAMQRAINAGEEHAARDSLSCLHRKFRLYDEIVRSNVSSAGSMMPTSIDRHALHLKL